MKAFFKKIISGWYICLIGLFIVAVFAMYMITGENSYIAIPDNLDLFMAQYKMMQNTGTFFARDALVPFLGGVSRDNLPGEFYLYTVLFEILPPFTAYVAGYILKIIIASAKRRNLFFEPGQVFNSASHAPSAKDYCIIFRKLEFGSFFELHTFGSACLGNPLCILFCKSSLACVNYNRFHFALLLSFLLLFYTIRSIL